MLRNPKLKDYGITLNGIEHVYAAFTKSDAKGMAKKAHDLKCMDCGLVVPKEKRRCQCGTEKRLPPGCVRELDKRLTQAIATA